MSRPKPKRTTWPPETRAEALRIARAEGAVAAEKATGVGAGTIRSWLARDNVAAVERRPEAEADELKAKPATAMSVTEWADLQRLAEARYRKAMLSGSPSDQRWCAISLGVVTDKLRQAREGTGGDGRADPSRVAEVIKNRDELATRLLRMDALRMRDLSRLDVDDLRVEIERCSVVIGKAYRARRMLGDEMLRRRTGAPSLFANIDNDKNPIPEPWIRPAEPERTVTWKAPTLARVEMLKWGRDLQVNPEGQRIVSEADDIWHEIQNRHADEEIAALEAEEAEAKVVPIRPRRYVQTVRTARVDGVRRALMDHQGLRAQDLVPTEEENH